MNQREQTHKRFAKCGLPPLPAPLEYRMAHPAGVNWKSIANLLGSISKIRQL